MSPEHELRRVGESLVFEAGLGEWYNQNRGGWDMGDDAVLRPPAGWHIELKRLLGSEHQTPVRLIVDVTDMVWLISADIGFLRRVAMRLKDNGGSLHVVAPRNVVMALRIVTPDHMFSAHETMEAAVAGQ